jgi:hypothetical protein
MCAAIALLKLTLGFFIAAQAGQRKTAIVVGTSVGRVGFFSVCKKLFGPKVILLAESKFAEASERTGVVGVARQDVLEERSGFVIVMGVESDLAKLIVGFGLLGLKSDRGFELAAGIFRVQERGIDVSEAVVRGLIFGAGSEIGFVMALCLGHLLLFGFETRESIKDGGVGRSQLPCRVQSFVGFGKLAEFESLEAAVELEVGRVWELFACMAQSDERAVWVVIATTGNGEFGGSSDFSFAGGNMIWVLMRALREDGFKAIHGFGIAVLREQEIADGKVGSNGVGLRGESASEGLAGFLSLVKVEQSVAKKDESGGVVGVLLGVRAEKRCGVGGFVLQAALLGRSKCGIGLRVGRSLQTSEDQRQEQTEATRTMHGIPL